ncbi:Acyltransferase [Carpediemonas membranifera]|uniref:Acyltransferase n=1 Tax=Carpediemonas membranifera TaxID=201153 RepID=A0A8J6AUX2_9EUKA|nr:Acyltransferase [Carpediemonas membranifera]|eukprot:KAG9393110.1 Acyltransferase [Carpediemonas membranifera]
MQWRINYCRSGHAGFASLHVDAITSPRSQDKGCCQCIPTAPRRLSPHLGGLPSSCCLVIQAHCYRGSRLSRNMSTMLKTRTFSEEERSAFSPFIDDQPAIGRYEHFKMLLLGPIAPLRFIVGVLIVMSVAPVFRLITRTKAPSRAELTAMQRRMIDLYGAFVMRVALFIGGYLWIRRKGKRVRMVDGVHVPVVVNHQSWVDIPITAASGCFGFIAKDAVEKIPVIGQNAKLVGTVYVDRTSAESRRNAVQTINDVVRDTRGAGLTVWPEGTTTNGSCVLPFKATVFAVAGKCGVPVQPMTIKYGHRCYNVTLASADWKENFFRILTQFVNKAEVTYLPVMSMEEGETAEAFAERVRAAMADDLAAPMLDYPARRKYVYREYLKGKIPLSEAVQKAAEM